MDDLTSALAGTSSTMTTPAVHTSDVSHLFSWVDYVVFSIMLLLSALIGVFYAYKDRNKQDSEEFLMAGRSMTTFPVAMSLIASFMSAITLLGTPSEIYTYGTSYWLIGFSYFIVMPATAFLYFPVFWDLKVTSSYEYLEVRFSKPVRLLGSIIFSVQMLLYMAIVVYAPALALGQVTGLDEYLSVSLICFVCIFYTTLGGMKAVLWTDSLQVVIMYLSILFIIIKTTLDLGGFAEVWRKNSEAGRVDLIDFDVNPTTRHTVWTLVIGGYFTWIAIYGVNQAQVQRYLCVRDRKMVPRALWMNLFGLLFLMLLCAFGGMLLFAKYEGCDPVKSGRISKNDQLFPLIVMEMIGHLKGLPGVFVAGIFAGALSTVSSGMNSLAAIAQEDFVKGIFFPDLSHEVEGRVSKGLSLAFGLVTFGLVFVAEQLGNVLSAALSIFGMIGGPLAGLFSLGMFFPWANSIGAFTGAVVSLIITFWIGVGYQVELQNGHIILPAKPVSIDKCLFNVTTAIKDTTTTTEPLLDLDGTMTDTETALGIYRISYMWYSFVGFWVVIIVGLIVSYFTKFQNIRTLNPKTISPGVFWLRKLLPKIDEIGGEFSYEERALNENKSTLSLGNVNFSFKENGIELNNVASKGSNNIAYINEAYLHENKAAIP